MDCLVSDDSKEILFFMLKRYREHPTNEKLKCIIMNLPIGFLISNNALNNIIITDRAISYNELIDLLLNPEKIKETIER